MYYSRCAITTCIKANTENIHGFNHTCRVISTLNENEQAYALVIGYVCGLEATCMCAFKNEFIK